MKTSQLMKKSLETQKNRKKNSSHKVDVDTKNWTSVNVQKFLPGIKKNL